MATALISKFLILISLFKLTNSIASQVYANEQERPNISVLELQLKENETLVFGEVESVDVVKNNNNNLKGFKFFQVTLNVNSVWSKNKLAPASQYRFVFGTMVDDKDIQSTTPVKYKEKLAVVMDSYKPNEVHTLKDHLLNIYEHHLDTSNGKEYFISKLTKHYSQRNLVLSDLQRVAFTEKMHIYDLSKVKNDTKTIQRSIASELSTPDVMPEYLQADEESKIKRQPTSSYNNKEDELSVYGLLVVLFFLAIFSHFVIKYYEDPEEEY